MIADLEKRLERLKTDLQTGLAQLGQMRKSAAELETQLHAQNGAIAECELWLEVARNKEVKPQPGPDEHEAA